MSTLRTVKKFVTLWASRTTTFTRPRKRPKIQRREEVEHAPLHYEVHGGRHPVR